VCVCVCVCVCVSHVLARCPLLHLGCNLDLLRDVVNSRVAPRRCVAAFTARCHPLEQARLASPVAPHQTVPTTRLEREGAPINEVGTATGVGQVERARVDAADGSDMLCESSVDCGDASGLEVTLKSFVLSNDFEGLVHSLAFLLWVVERHKDLVAMVGGGGWWW
jgi:hypothetical protein